MDVSENAIAGSFSDVVGFITSCGSLAALNASTNLIGGEVTPAAGGDFNCSSVENLDLSRNRLYGVMKEGVFNNCANLKYLNLSSNQFVGSLPEDLNLNYLETINLSNNSFSGEVFDGVLYTKSLKEIQLSFNRFSGDMADKDLNFPNLELLDLSSNNFSGFIHKNLCSVSSKLKELYLQNNLFRGRIPDNLSNCSILFSLDLSFNYLHGPIPESFGALTQLKDLILWQNYLEGEIPKDLKLLSSLENLILDNNGLTGPIPNGLRNCSNLNWISLSSNRMSGEIPSWIGKLEKLAILKLSNNSFFGSIPKELGDCKSLIWLDLNSNNLSGKIPNTLAKQSGKIAVGLVTGKEYVYLKSDGSSMCRGSGNLLEFAGIRSDELDRLPSRQSCNFSRIYKGSTKYTFNDNGSLIFLDLSYNHLEGEIPNEIGDMSYLAVLNLGHNLLSGTIPEGLGNLHYVGVFDLSHNFLEGNIPNSFSRLTSLTEIDLSNNKLNGTIPESGQLGTFPSYRYENNSGLCGFPLPACVNNPLPGVNEEHQMSKRRQASIVASVSLVLLIIVLSVFCTFIYIIESKKRKKKKSSNSRDIYIDSRSHSGTANGNWKLTDAEEALSISLATFDQKPLQKITFADLLEATNGFRSDSLVGSGGFGDVYKAQLKNGNVVAIKKLIHISNQGDREFMAEMETIGKIKHRNLVPLLGYCKVGDERLLVYEYMKYGSLEDVLQDRKKLGLKLNWAARRKIAIGAARGLAFLHHNCFPHIIHRDMKSSNVLLDENLEARVSDFGMARMMSAVDTHLSVSTLAGTPGYVPPEYYQSFRCTTKGDVYSYGVVLLELLTGRQPTDSSDFGDNNLVGWVKQHSKFKISDVFDRELMKEDPGLELELLQHLKIACACLDDRPMRRPTMVKVMAMFKEIQAGSTVDSSGTDIAGSVVDGSFTTSDMSLRESKEERDN